MKYKQYLIPETMKKAYIITPAKEIVPATIVASASATNTNQLLYNVDGVNYSVFRSATEVYTSKAAAHKDLKNY